ncbi:MAG: transglutaminase-like domain-containing protein [Desulfobacterales bacterium]|nr:transglutaminase-like domain-containing protein [Desulfobacterales bacterium]
MSLYHNKPFWLVGFLFSLGFLTLFAIRLGLIEKVFNRPQPLSISDIKSSTDKDIWMKIVQNNRKIGFSHSRFSAELDGYRLQETVLMRINTMGMVQNVNLKTSGRLNPDFSLVDFDFNIKSGRFSFNVNGSVEDDMLTVRTTSAGTSRKANIPLKAKPYLLPAVTAAVSSAKLETGTKYTFDIFDPATMGQTPVIVEVLGRENLTIMGAVHPATKIALNFKGTAQQAWIGEQGDILREEGILGIQLEKTTRKDALRDLTVAASADLTQTASVASNIQLADLEQLGMLQVELSGVPAENVQLSGGRQTFKGRVLTITREILADLPPEIRERDLANLEKIFLKPGPFIQSDHEKIRTLSQEITGNAATPLEKVRRLSSWVFENIDKRPVLSLPDALSTLENRVGDCNEHAVLFAALARAAGIPCRLEAGLMYLKGRFYYHAWNLVYLGRWITVDSVYNQIPADVSHIRFVTGSPDRQLDLMGVIGKLKLQIINPL